jgi:hypothetical protein
MSKRKKDISNDFLTTEALKTEGLYFSHKSGRFFEVKLAKKKILGFPTVKMKMDDGETRNVVFFHVGLLMNQGTYEQIIPSEDLL